MKPCERKKKILLQLSIQLLYVVLLVQNGCYLAVPVAMETSKKKEFCLKYSTVHKAEAVGNMKVGLVPLFTPVVVDVVFQVHGEINYPHLQEEHGNSVKRLTVTLCLH